MKVKTFQAGCNEGSKKENMKALEQKLMEQYYQENDYYLA